MEKDYVPYGEEWEKEMMKLPKKMIIELFRKLAMEGKRCHDCNGELISRQGKSKKYGVYLCRDCWVKRELLIIKQQS